MSRIVSEQSPSFRSNQVLKYDNEEFVLLEYQCEMLQTCAAGFFELCSLCSNSGSPF